MCSRERIKGQRCITQGLHYAPFARLTFGTLACPCSKPLNDRKTMKKFGITFGLTIPPLVDPPKAENGKIIYNRIPSWDEVKKALKSVQSV